MLKQLESYKGSSSFNFPASTSYSLCSTKIGASGASTLWSTIDSASITTTCYTYTFYVLQSGWSGITREDLSLEGDQHLRWSTVQGNSSLERYELRRRSRRRSRRPYLLFSINDLLVRLILFTTSSTSSLQFMASLKYAICIVLTHHALKPCR